MRSLTKTGIRILSAKYRSILIKCAIINASVFIGMVGTGSAFADDVYVSSWMGLQGAVAGDANPIYVNGDITRGASDGDITISRTLSIIGTETGKYLSGADTYKGLAIDSDTNLTLKNITMQHFKNSDSGGAIYNENGIIDKIEGNFESNSAAGIIATDGGGAIYNTGTIRSIDGNFDYNSSYEKGGAIYNTGIITNITGSFNNNQVTNNDGGAIYNTGTIGTITGVDDGTGNIIAFKGNSSGQMGGAIYNNTTSTTEMNIIGDFIENSAKRGGAIYNDKGIIGDITGDFESNQVSTFGGAIYNKAKINTLNGNFNSNKSDSGGGAIYNNSEITNISGNFTNNSAKNYAGVLHNNNAASIVNFVAENRDITFSGNYVTSDTGFGGAIVNNGTVGLYAVNAGDKIEFKGTTPTEIPDDITPKDIDGIFNQATLNINGHANVDADPTSYAGTVNLYNVDGTGTTNIYGGTVNVAKDITQNNINVLSGATLSSTTNSASIVATTFVNAGTVNMSGDDSKLAAKNLTNNGIIDAISVVTEDSLTNNNTINATTGIEVGDILTNNETIEAVNLLATQITNKGDITTTDTKFGIANNNSGASLTVNGKVNSGISTAILTNEGNVTINSDAEKRIQLGNSGTANFNGKLDAGNSVIQLVENDGGIMNFSTNAIESTANLPISVFYLNGGSVNIADGRVNTLHVDQLKLTRETNFAMDADLAAESMDKIQIHDFTTSTFEEGKVININKINLLSDATQDKINLSIFADDATRDVLKNNVRSNIKGLTYSTIYKYDALYDSATGKIGFTRYNSGTSDDFNPYIYAPSGVANTTAAMTTQIATMVMDKMDDVVHAQGRSGGDTTKSSNAWVKVMGLNDNVEFNNFENIDSKAMTVTAGYNTNKITCGDNSVVFGAYAGYIGGKQQYTANDIDQDGGYIGLSSALTLGDAFLTATVNGGLLKNKANNMYGTDRFNTLWLGTGLKAGYNYALTDSVVLQPNVYGGYTLVNTKDYTSVSGVKIATNNLNFFEIDPGLKLSAVIADGWTGSVQGKYAIVMDNGADITANDIALQNISTKNYIEYGIGIDKSLTDAFYLGAKINRHDGGRTGWNGSIEFRYKF